ncbi:MAG TPA: signal peptidase I [Thermofilum sp.]|nr:signal peptidase I [Thermofilum sp.]
MSSEIGNKEKRNVKVHLSDLITVALLIALIVSLIIASIKGFIPLAVVSSWSMEPTIHVGDLIIIVSGGSYVPGDIVIYQGGVDKKLIVHRLIQIEGRYYVTKGDANRYPDFPISPGQVRGKVALIIPYLGVIKLAVEKVLRFLFTR